MSKSGLLSCLLLSLLAGCGGGGSPTSTPDVNTPDESEPEVEEPPPENTAPTARVASPGVVYGGTVVSLDGSASMDEDGDDLTYRWSVQGGANAHFVIEEGALRAL